MKKHILRRWARYLAPMAFMTAAGCASQVTISSNIRRTLPVIIDESRSGRRLEAGFTYRTGQDEGERINYYYQEAVNQSFTAYDRSDGLFYLRVSPWDRITLRLGIDGLGYTADLAARVQRPGIDGFVSAGATVADRSQVSGYTSSRPAYPRITLGASVAPLAVEGEGGREDLERYRIYGNVSFVRYPVWLDFTQSYTDSPYVAYQTWTIRELATGETKLVSGGLAYEGHRLLVSAGLQYPFGMTEQGVRVDLGSQPPYVVGASPAARASWALRCGVRF